MRITDGIKFDMAKVGAGLSLGDGVGTNPLKISSSPLLKFIK
jgi:hypothetical protein